MMIDMSHFTESEGDNRVDYSHILSIISSCDDPDKLRVFYANAHRKNVTEVYEAAQRRLTKLIPKAIKGSLEANFWDMIGAHQTLLLSHDRPTRKLSKAWALAIEEGVIAALEKWVEAGDQCWAFSHFMAKKQAKFTAEHIVKTFPDHFSKNLHDVAQQRLTQS